LPYCSFSAKLAHWGGGIVTGPQQKLLDILMAGYGIKTLADLLCLTCSMRVLKAKNTRYAWYAENCAKHSEWGEIEPKIVAGCGILRVQKKTM